MELPLIPLEQRALFSQFTSPMQRAEKDCRK